MNILFHIDTPIRESIDLSSEGLTINGWAIGKCKIDFFEISVNDKHYGKFTTEFDREDVYLIHDIYFHDKCGFSIHIKNDIFSSGSNKIDVCVVDANLNKSSFVYYVENNKNSNKHQSYFVERSKKIVSSLYFDLNSLKAKDILFNIVIDLRLYGDIETTLNSIFEQLYSNYKIYFISKETGARKAVNGHSKDAQYVSPQEFIDGFNLPDGYTIILKPGETLCNYCLSLVSQRIAEDRPSICYGDSDCCDEKGIHQKPQFKPDWSCEYLLSRNYIGGVFFIRDDFKVGNLVDSARFLAGKEYRYDLLLKCVEVGGSVSHIPDILWSETGATPCEDDYDYERSSVIAHLKRKEIHAAVSARGPGLRYVDYGFGEEKISIIIPTTGKLELVRMCAESLISKTNYGNFELIFVDNGRGKNPEGIAYLRSLGVKILEIDEPFNWSYLNNRAAEEASGDIYIFLNDDVEIKDPAWLSQLACQVRREHVGVVGALLLYPDGRIQHAGVFLVDHGGGARHWLQFEDPTTGTYLDLHKVVREVSANTGACLAVRRDVFEAIGGFDEELPIVGNDVDFCLRVSKLGYKNIWTPESCLVHHESVSRKNVHYADDEKKMWLKWGALYLSGDPFYNKNLSLYSTDCALAPIQPVCVNCSTDGKLGVNLIGPIRAEMGIGEGMRGNALAMTSADVPFDVLNYEYNNPARMGDRSWVHRIVDAPQYNVNLLHINANLTLEAIDYIGHEFFEGKYNIGYWAWELPDFPDEWVPVFDSLNEVWVPSEFVACSVRAKSPVPVHVVPHVIQKLPISYLTRSYFSLPDSAFLFLSMYDVYSIQQRKNPKGAIQAFKNAFVADDLSVGLVVKVNNGSLVELDEIRAFVHDYKNIYILHGDFDRYETDSLIHSCNAFVSLHRSEGFGLVMAEAMAMGRPVIATDWSGNVDFMNKDNAGCVGFELQKLGNDYGPYKAYQHWAEPNLDEASSLMAKFAADSHYVQAIGSQARQQICQNLSPAAVGSLISRRLENIYAKTK